MKIVIPLCRHCSRDKDKCEHRATLRKAVRDNGSNVTVIHNCTVYRTLWTPGERVWVDMKEWKPKYYPGVRPEEGDPYNAYWGGEWVDAPPQQGTIVETTSKRFFVVTFDAPITVSRPKKTDGPWGEGEMVEIENIAVYADRLHREKPELAK